MTTDQSTFWKRKLAAYLHDSPEKVLSIVDHEERARRIAGLDWLPEEKSRKEADWAASRHSDFALYPAETRLPDHTIWNHLAVTSAMQGYPALLIESADAWSGHLFRIKHCARDLNSRGPETCA